MSGKYKALITSYCAENGIVIPPGFGRHAPSRYAIVRLDQAPPRLVATTWFKTTDVAYFIEHFLQSELGDRLRDGIRIFDFGAREELVYRGGRVFDRIGPIPGGVAE